MISACRYDGCSVGLTYANRTMVRFELRAFGYNSPKPEELIRTKVFFKHEDPMFSIEQSGKEIIFGNISMKYILNKF